MAVNIYKGWWKLAPLDLSGIGFMLYIYNKCISQGSS